VVAILVCLLCLAMIAATGVVNTTSFNALNAQNLTAAGVTGQEVLRIFKGLGWVSFAAILLDCLLGTAFCAKSFYYYFSADELPSDIEAIFAEQTVCNAVATIMMWSIEWIWIISMCLTPDFYLFGSYSDYQRVLITKWLDWVLLLVAWVLNLAISIALRTRFTGDKSGYFSTMSRTWASTRSSSPRSGTTPRTTRGTGTSKESSNS